jgi:hypothetical protein
MAILKMCRLFSLTNAVRLFTAVTPVSDCVMRKPLPSNQTDTRNPLNERILYTFYRFRLLSVDNQILNVKYEWYIQGFGQNP